MDTFLLFRPKKLGKIKKATVSGDFSLIGVAKRGIEPPNSSANVRKSVLNNYFAILR
jgi:hypothetical protein